MTHARLLLTAALASLTLCGAASPSALADSASALNPDPERGGFAACVGWHRVTCIVDGDTIWYRGEKIRIADINAPELLHPSCPFEAKLAAAATERLTVLLNQGPFSLAPWPGRHFDQYGRSLYVLTRDGRSLGMVLVDEGLAERWKGYRGNWC